MSRSVFFVCLGVLVWGSAIGQAARVQDPESTSPGRPEAREKDSPAPDAEKTLAEATSGETAGVTADGRKADRGKSSLQNPRAAMQTFLQAMETQDYRTAITALDFSQIQPVPDTFLQIRYAQMLKECVDRLALVDLSQLSDSEVGSEESFPPGKPDSMLKLGSGADGQWRFTSQSVAGVPALYDILKDKPPIGELGSTAALAPSASDSTEALAPETEKETGTGQEKPDVSLASVPDALKSARRTMRTLFDGLKEKDYPTVVAALDFSKMEAAQPELGPYAKLEYARCLRDVIQRMADLNYADISDDPAGPVFRFPIDEAHQPIVISRGESGVWQFAAETVDRIDSLYEIYADKPVLFLTGAQRPWYLRELAMDNEVWRFLALFAAIFLSVLAGHVIRYLAQKRSDMLKARDRLMTSLAFATIAKTARGIALLVGLACGINVLTLDFTVEKFAATVIRVIFTLIVGYICFRLVDVVVGFLKDLARKTGSTLNDMLVPVVSTALRITIIVLVVLEIATTVSDQPPSALIAGLGAGGLAIGLAAQDTIKNFFGSVMIFADRPFDLGDRIVVDGHDGPVESVGFRSTRIRTLDGHLVTVPNGEMSNRTIHNIGKRLYIRRIMNIRLAYDLPLEKVQRSMEILRELLDHHQGMNEELPPRVFLHEFLESAINIRAIYWFHPPHYWDYCDFGEQLNLQIMQQFAAEGIRFALPTQRLFVSGDLPRDRKREETAGFD